MARQDVNFGFTSTGADGLARDFKKVGDTATLAAKGARLCADELRAEERASKTAADGLAKAERVSALLAVTEHELDKEIGKTTRSLLEQGAAGEIAGKGAEKGAGGFSSLAGGGGIGGGGMVAAVAAGVALAPVLVTVGVGLTGVAAAAYSTVGPILKAGTATKQARDALAGLDPAQRAAYDSLGKLKAQFAGFGKALEPTVLDLFNKGLHIASGLMTDIAPVAKNVGDALGLVLGAVDKEFRSGTWQQFFKFMADTAGPDVKLLGDLFVALLGDPAAPAGSAPAGGRGAAADDHRRAETGRRLEKFHLILPLLGAAIGSCRRPGRRRDQQVHRHQHRHRRVLRQGPGQREQLLQAGRRGRRRVHLGDGRRCREHGQARGRRHATRPPRSPR